MTENIEAIVLGYTKFGENSVVVHTLSEAYGRRGFLVRVGKKAGMALLLPLNILEMDIVPNPKSTLWSARNLTAKDPLNGIRNNLYKNTMSLFLSEVLLRAVKDGQAEDGLYSPTSTSGSCWNSPAPWASAPPSTTSPPSRKSTSRSSSPS